MANELYGSIEAGGTKFVCAVGDKLLNIIDSVQFSTEDPKSTLTKTVDYFKQFTSDLKAISLASFGPIDIIKGSETYGCIQDTPKMGWSHTDLFGFLTESLQVPIHVTTDVNASAQGEMTQRSDINSLVYYTVGTGIGAGAIQASMEIGQIGHPEMGHILVAKHPKDQEFVGICPFHKDCLEGLAAGPSLEARTGIRGENIAENHSVWEIQAYYIAQALLQTTLTLRPEIIVLGGGVMSQNHVLQLVRKQFSKLLNDYITVPPLEDYIVTPIIENNGSATLGNFYLARKIDLENN
ncbi:fructokinase ScrK [Streptococcus parauberis]|uniref:Fructokinase n=1 Tax=Streptococcus parauberis NCFD 2020 TaxID=873447 RepID=F1YXB4_9STRE|nr:fructokinase ScrK [Streptococcus parauberis]EGE53605.1 fructokinase [Streptococcus parauberis NCFD 2020]